MSIRFITDSMCDISEDLLRRYSFDILPIPITLGDKTCFDGIDITPEMVVDYVSQNGAVNFPKTSQVQAVAYQETFEKHLKNGDDIIYLALSSGLSGTYQTASLIAGDLLEQYPDRKIAIVDSKCATTGMALILHQGLKLDKLGKPFETIVGTMNFLAQHIQIFFLVGDIKWLAKGGRINKNVAAIGDMLKIIPILYFKDGQILAFDKVRGQKKALKKMLTAVDECMHDKNQIVGFINSTAPELQDKVVKQLGKEMGIKSFLLPEAGAGSALTVHIGKDCLGIMFFDALPEDYIPVYP
ncbi:MAG: DegV family protein [Eubacterium sp.]|nr:DegV family protein [Eubacterium sp.]